MESRVEMDWSVDRQAISFVGRWRQTGEPPEFVQELMGWDPVAGEIRISGIFYHGAFFTE